MSFQVSLFYRYVPIEDTNELINAWTGTCTALKLKGRILISKEGVNGTLSGTLEEIKMFETYMKEDARFSSMDIKYSTALKCPFPDLSVRYTQQIISVGQHKYNEIINKNVKFNPDTYGGVEGTGTHLTPAQFHEAMLSNPGICVDVRNSFEYDVGHFTGAINLHTYTYSETWSALDTVLKDKDPSDNIYMYCTGGIRCEKASVYVRARGYKNVFQLEGGIHRYLEAFPDGLFQGKNFVFDKRVEDEPSLVDGSNVGIVVPSPLGASPSLGSTGVCLDCNCNFDVYSGSRCCTVCRTPLLMCSECVERNPYKNEYWCFRHRFLKDTYFTVLDPFSKEDLIQQDANLATILRELSGSKADKNRRRTIRRQREKIAVRLSELATSELVSGGHGGEKSKNPKSDNSWGFWRTGNEAEPIDSS
jgi:predicted sulfurtransferase